jgi:hypothetical protein
MRLSAISRGIKTAEAAKDAEVIKFMILENLAYSASSAVLVCEFLCGSPGLQSGEIDARTGPGFSP